MSEAKPTPGPWLTHREGFSTIYIQASIGGGWVQEIAACGPTNEGGAQQEANARLIADAGTVFHTTGLTPSQLVERVKELEELLNGVLLMDRMYSGRIVIEGWQEEVLRSALSKARPNTAEGEAAGQAPAGATPGRAMDEAAARKAAHEGYEKRITRVSERNPHDEGMYTLGWWDCAWNAAHPTTTAQAAPAAAKEPSP